MAFHSRKRPHESSDAVADHYNARDDKGLKEREQSRIYYMKNFNNWMKSMLISDGLNRVRSNKNRNQSLSVLDLCSGKGGDLLKWKIGGIDNLVCADIAETSVEHCKERFDLIKRRPDRGGRPLFSAQFIVADCSKTKLKTLFKNPNESFDITSCQFAIHYSFESLDQAKMMVTNACECLKPGGLFIGTMPNANVLVKRWREVDGNTFGNDVYRVKFNIQDKTNIPLFGAKYDFFLEDAVNCPEFLVYFPMLERLAAEMNMKLVYLHSFSDFYDIHSKTQEGKNLLRKMMAFEKFPPEGNKLPENSEDYKHARNFMKESSCSHIGTISKSEWEATNLYMVFMFQKKDDHP